MEIHENIELKMSKAPWR